MSEMTLRHRPEVIHAMAAAAWVLGAALLSFVLFNVITAVVIGAGMFAVLMLDLGPEIGIPVYVAALVGVVLAFAAVVHVALALIEKVTPVPWLVWPAIALPPALLIAAEVFDGADVYEPMFGMVGLLGWCIAWATTRWRRSRQTSSPRSASNAPER